jgi:PhoPQ-activated pathogenicity-related protein
MRRWIAIVWIVLGAAGAHAAGSPETALADYVAKPDSSYEWREHARYEVPGAEIVELYLHSQTWQDVLWKHQLILIRPTELADPAQAATTRQGLLIIGGGRWREGSDLSDRLPDGARIFVEMAQRLETVVAVLAQVPFQPLFGMTEDELIAYSFEQYLETGDNEWPLLLPMVKSVVRAMDATQAFVSETWQMPLDRFTVIGGSKRGWTTWLVGAVEPRAAALVPTVIDALNFEKHFPYQTTIWGAPSEKLAPYSRRHLPEMLSSPAGRDLRAIVDPYSYREQLTQPKLVVVATKDAYFPVDSLNLYWDDLPDPKYVLYLPNDVHSIKDYGRLIPALNALHRYSADGTPMPDLEWEYETVDDALRLCVRSDPSPVSVAIWLASSPEAGFREAQFVPQLVQAHDGIYVFDLVWPVEGYRAIFGEAFFVQGDNRYVLSTNLRITDKSGHAPSEATAIVGHTGVCPHP